MSRVRRQGRGRGRRQEAEGNKGRDRKRTSHRAMGVDIPLRKDSMIIGVRRRGMDGIHVYQEIWA